MVAFYLYLGLLAFLAVYSLYHGVKDAESYLTSGISILMLAGLITLKAFDLYAILLAFFLFSGLILVVVSDLGLFFMNPTPWKKLINEFPTYTGLVGLLAIIASVELWMEYNRFWIIFQIIFSILMTITFLTSFVRVIRWCKSGILVTLSLFFALVLIYANYKGFFGINTYLFYWIVSVIIQSILLFIWRSAVRLYFVKFPEKSMEY